MVEARHRAVHSSGETSSPQFTVGDMNHRVFFCAGAVNCRLGCQQQKITVHSLIVLLIRISLFFQQPSPSDAVRRKYTAKWEMIVGSRLSYFSPHFPLSQQASDHVRAWQCDRRSRPHLSPFHPVSSRRTARTVRVPRVSGSISSSGSQRFSVFGGSPWRKPSAASKLGLPATTPPVISQP